MRLKICLKFYNIFSYFQNFSMLKKQQKDSTKLQPLKIKSSMKINDLMILHPDTTDVMLSYNLHCVGCSINEFDTLEQGAKIHGLSAEDNQALLEDLQDVFQQILVYEAHDMNFTKGAVEQIKSFQKQENKEGRPLYIQYTFTEEGPEFALDFIEKISDTQTSFIIDDITIIVETSILSELQGFFMDYRRVGDEEGFQIKIL